MGFGRVLVTGGAGFLGNRVVNCLSRRGTFVAVLDNGFVKMPLQARSEFVEPYDGDIRDLSLVEKVFRDFNPDAIIHLAAIHHIPTCESNPHLAMDVNVVGTQAILDTAERYKVNNIVLASSAAVYDWWDSPLSEDHTPLKATDVYSTGKLTNESQLRVWATRSGGRGVIARIFNVIGHDDPNAHLIPDILAQMKLFQNETRPPDIYLGNTLPKRDYTHADDTTSGLLTLLDKLELLPEVSAFNISRGEEYSVVDLVNEIATHFGTQVNIKLDPARIRRFDRLHLLGDTTKMKAFGWQSKIAFSDGIKLILDHI